MKVLDFTPLRKPDGTFEPIDRIKATLKFGPSWFATLEGQDHVVALLERNLDSAYTLLRNFTLPGTELIFPLILIGPLGVLVLNVLNERGLFRAKGEEWGIIQGERVIAARINPLKRTLQYVAVLQKYLVKLGLEQVKVEGVLLGASPGLQVESVRPAARVVMFDALDRFAISIAQTSPVLARSLVQQVLDRLQNPTLTQATAPTPLPSAESADKPTSVNDDRLSLGLDTDQPVVRQTPAQHVIAKAAHRPATRKKKKGGLSNRQLAILGAVFLFWVCLLVIFILWAVINAF